MSPVALEVIPFGGSLFNSGKPDNYWEGIVAPRESWPRDDSGIEDKTQLKEWGYRVRVRIHGIHPPDKNLLPDNQLPLIEIKSTSCGSGHKGTGLSMGVTQGSIIYGFWLDLVNKKNPVYCGTLPNNDQITLRKTQPQNNGFLPFSGYNYTDVVPGYDIPFTQGFALESYSYPNLWGISDKSILDEGTFGISSPTDCEKVPLNGILKSMRDLIRKIEKVQKQLREWQSAAQGWISEKQQWIQGKIQEASRFISGGLKWLFKEIRKFVEEQINNQTKKLQELINPPDRDKAKVAKDSLMEIISCLFNKLINNLFKLVGNFLSQMLDRYINVPACAVSNFIGNLLGNILGALGGAIDSIIGRLSAFLGGAFSIADSILGLLSAIAGFFACEESQECPETRDWNIFEGGRPSAVFDIDSIINQAKQIAASVTNLVDIDNIANIDFSDLINQASNASNGCNIGPVFCGPPTVTFWGGGGSGATGNVIVSAVGDILGVDIISSGSGYTKAPFVTIEDNCGKGSGVSGRPIMVPDGGTDSTTGLPTYGVGNVVITDPGAGYIPRPDGDLGGDGRVWAPKENTVIQRPDGTYEQYTPDEEVPERDGDTVISPGDRQILDPGLPTTGPVFGGGVGGGVNDLDGDSPIEDRISNAKGITKIPGTGNNGETVFDSFPYLNIGSYPVILYLCDIVIENAGLNYSSEDKVVIEPNPTGAEIEVTFGPFGTVNSVRITNPGNGFTERPNIYIQSETGYNAQLLPVFCISRIGDDKDGDIPDDVLFGRVVSVVDCVGRVD
jgi:hypothetical protein